MLKKTVKSKLQVNLKEKATLIATLERFAEACNLILETANQTGKRRAYDLHHACYYKIKEQTDLTSNYVVRAIARVAQSFGKKRPPTKFFATSLDLDKDLFYYIPFQESISIATVEGRLKLKLQLGNYQRHLLIGQKPKAATLSYDSRKKAFYINFVIEVDKSEPQGLGTLGVDLGINRIATTSDGERNSGRKINRIRERYQRTRSSLQAKCTKGAKRTLKRLRGRQAKFTKDVNHKLSKKIVNKAKATNRAIIMEDLKGIRERCCKKGKQLRKLLGNWSFYQLRSFIEYKAAEAGVVVRLVNPAYTSRSCSNCFALGLRRKHKFRCPTCGYTNDADVNASLCIAALEAQVNRPEVAALCERQAALL
jgi:putative transposase